MNIDNNKSYATEANLMTALIRVNLSNCHPIVVRNREGRWTAIFTTSRCDRVGVPLIAPPHAGFMVVN